MVACSDFFKMSEICRPEFIVRHSTATLGWCVSDLKISKLRYQKELEIFTQWQTEKRIKGKDENVTAYFNNIEAASTRS
jgi:hypothetical protein